MNGELAPFGGRHDDHLQEIPSPVRADDQPAVGIGAGIFKSKGMVDGVEDVLVDDAVFARRLVVLHPISVLRKSPNASSRTIESAKPERHNRPEGSRAHFPKLNATGTVSVELVEDVRVCPLARR